jgi:Protein of unknown function (DUF3102)
MSDLVLDRAERIHKLLEAAFGMTIRAAIDIGEALTEQKAAMKHGEFGPWLKTNFPDVTWQTANKYMRAYANREEVEVKLKPGFNLTEAYKLGPKRKRTPKPKPAPEPEVIDTEGVTVDTPPEDTGPLLDTSDVDKLEAEPDPYAPSEEPDGEGPPILPGETVKDVVALSGLPKPINWTPPKTAPEGEDPREKFKAFGVSPIKQMSREEAKAKRPDYEWPEGSRETHEGYEAYVMQDEDPHAFDPLREERYALSDEVIELATEVVELSNEATLVKVLTNLLNKRLRKN